ncbi:hypothetical protein HELA111659_10865 [Helicobacter labetoulli]
MGRETKGQNNKAKPDKAQPKKTRKRQKNNVGAAHLSKAYQ